MPPELSPQAESCQPGTAYERPKPASQGAINLGKLAYLSSPLRLLFSQESYKPHPKLATRREDAMQDANENLNKHSQFLPSPPLYPYYIN